MNDSSKHIIIVSAICHEFKVKISTHIKEKQSKMFCVWEVWGCVGWVGVCVCVFDLLSKWQGVNKGEHNTCTYTSKL